MEDKETLGHYIMEKRKEKNLTQKAFAECLFVTESAVSKWERGLSYPDISLIRKICAVLEVTEHELLTATEDTEHREMQRRARNYKRMGDGYRFTLIALYTAALVTCLICNLAIDHTLSWFFIVLASIGLAFTLTLLPAYVKKNTGCVVLGASTGALCLLLVVCNLYSGGGWWSLMAICAILFGVSVCFLPYVLRVIPLPPAIVHHKSVLYMAINTVLLLGMLLVIMIYNGTPAVFLTKALPTALFWLVIPWAMVLIIRYLPVNAFLKTAGCLFSLTAVYNFAYAVMERIYGAGSQTRNNEIFVFHTENRAYIDFVGGEYNFVVLLCLIAMTVIFTVVGALYAYRARVPRDA